MALFIKINTRIMGLLRHDFLVLNPAQTPF